MRVTARWFGHLVPPAIPAAVFKSSTKFSEHHRFGDVVEMIARNP